ncbi:hypothetical protein PoB_003064000 [Plakobranchus ocellatus]|uniref:Uncharacterized protein n=1 Tax=Plakobranchus ocellatus TaxID=259542 RepID=A0AAV4A7J6_9GAST|nr:hypothetical protein PoB_003064000 [Plakobranchus ocellatus]
MRFSSEIHGRLNKLGGWRCYGLQNILNLILLSNGSYPDSSRGESTSSRPWRRMLHATPQGFHGRHYGHVLKGKRDPQNSRLVRCSNELEQNEFQAKEVLKPVHKKRQVR